MKYYDEKKRGRRLSQCCIIMATVWMWMMNCSAQKAVQEPHVGYVFPAGGQQGTTLRVLVGGQYLGAVKTIHVSGNGLSGTVIQHYRPIRNLDVMQRREIMRQIQEAWQKQTALLPEAERARLKFPALPGPMMRGGKADPAATPVVIPSHPLLNHMETKTIYELAHTARQLKEFRKRQPNAQIGEMVEIELLIAPDAVPGPRELRLGAASAYSNPLIFYVSGLPERMEQEPNDPDMGAALPPPPPAILPAVFNGQILPGDVDRLRFSAQKGQALTVEVSARKLIPYLADAVPGWFQVVAAVYDSEGRQIVYADDAAFEPDPVFSFTIPEDGVYVLEIRDAVFRGREDFVYRATVGELPVVRSMFPLGARLGEERTVLLQGQHLPHLQLVLDTDQEMPGMYPVTVVEGGHILGAAMYELSEASEIMETEPNDASEQSLTLAVDSVVNGRIQVPGDMDRYAFNAEEGQELIVEVVARRLLSPLDALLRIQDEAGNVLSWNDDYKDRRFEFMTHHADARIAFLPPKSGRYYVEISDTQRNGGPEYGYRLHLRAPRPDFALMITPSALNMRAGKPVSLKAHALRMDGFDGEIELSLKEAPDGLVLAPARIPAGQDSIEVILKRTRRVENATVFLQVYGRAAIGDDVIERKAIPAEDRMQAFLPRHITPVHELLLHITGGKKPLASGKGEGEASE